MSPVDRVSTMSGKSLRWDSLLWGFVRLYRLFRLLVSIADVNHSESGTRRWRLEL
jgi:hypothetical protein